MIEFISMFFEKIWELFQIPYPGFGFSVATVAIGALCAVFCFRLIGYLTGWSFSIGGWISHVKGGNNKNIKVSKSRAGDTK